MPDHLARRGRRRRAHAADAGHVLLAVPDEATTEAQSSLQSGCSASVHLAIHERHRRTHAADAGYFLVAVSVKAATARPAPAPALAARKAQRSQSLKKAGAVPTSRLPASRAAASTAQAIIPSMAHNESTGKKAASAASKVLRSPSSSKAAKSAAASALTQRKGKH